MPRPLVIDLSHHQTPREMGFAASAGILASIVKISEGVGGMDRSCAAHLHNSLSAGLLVAGYHFGTGKRPGIEQADYMLGVLAAVPRLPDDFPLILDIERNPAGDSMTLAQAVDFYWRLRVVRPRARLGMYLGSYGRELNIPSSSPLLDAFQWLADYAPPATVVPPWPSWTLWQFTDRAGAAPGPDALDGYDLSAAADGEETIRQIWGVAA